MTTLSDRSGYRSTTAGALGDPLAVAASLAGASTAPHVLYERAGQWSFGAGAAYELLLYPDRIEVRDDFGARTLPTGPAPLQQIADLLAACPLPGWRAYGWAGFELAYFLHGLPQLAGPEPLLHLIVPETEVRWQDGEATLRALDPGALPALAERLAGEPAPAAGAPLDLDEGELGEEYRKAVAAAVEDIRARQLQKVILSRVVPVPQEIDLAATYLLGRRGNTPARSFLLDLGVHRAAGFSPETVVEVDAHGLISTQPLAGTRALTGDPAADHDRHEELLADPKEIFEHAISVKAACEELYTMSERGSVTVDEFMNVRRRGSVQHLASRVGARLAPGRNAWHALAALFPAVTASGLPKTAACTAIHRYESAPRGLYSGAVLTADADGSLDAALVLRTVFQRDGRTWLRAGAGIVEHSTPEREFEETCEKLRSTSRFLVPRTRSDAGSPEGPRDPRNRDFGATER
ncbi:mycobactin biosynthesis salicylate synthase MbtI [Streptomyces amakusaensis]|uniref:Salicylate synthase n=1 Tax=Streptomyces amakusaensis TaxID=67271 RepID=A0ABW0ASQ7_9ACTN